MSEKFALSVAVIAKNEEKRLDDCLKSVAWANDIVVIDDMSTDRTVEIAEKYTTNIKQRKMDVEGTHRNYAYSQAENQWVMSLDADERVTPELAEEIKRVLGSDKGEYNAYAIPIKTYMGNRWIKGAGYYPARKVRIFRKDKFRYEDSGVHPRIFLEGKCGELNGDILHYSWNNLSEFLTKINRETTLEAEKWLQDGRKVTFWNIFRKTIDRFLKNYFLKKGYKDGFYGFLFSYFHSYYQLMSYAKYYERVNHIMTDRPR